MLCLDDIIEPEQTQGNGEGKPGVLQVIGSRRVGRDLATEI